MSFGSYFLARVAQLPKARFRTTRTRNIRVKMRDGATLETDLYVPRNGVRNPTILMRVPYGIRGFDTVSEVYAERGYNAVLQACRDRLVMYGCVDPSEGLEPNEVVAGRVRAALRYLDPTRILLAPDCGLITVQRETARAKAQQLVQVAAELRDAL